MSNQRQRTIVRQGSPRYQYALPAIAAAASMTFAPDIQWPASVKYSPLDLTEISNLDAVDVNVILNGKSIYVVPAYTTRVIDDYSVRQIRIENRSATTASIINMITVSCERQPMTADMASRV